MAQDTSHLNNVPAQGNEIDLQLHTIGWKAFQDLCAQLCKVELGAVIEVFNPIKDGGQDAAFSFSENGKTLNGTIQCKHSSKPNQIAKSADLDNAEKEKIRRLVSQGAAEKYIFILSYTLPAPIALEIKRELCSLGVKTPMVWGREKISDVVKNSAKLRALVPQVYGLGDLSAILDQRAFEQTSAVLEDWKPKLKTYVSTNTHIQAVEKLSVHNVVLLLGNPASGKSAIGAVLSTINAEGEDHNVLKLTSPKDFETHWSPSVRNTFFWFDDAFGSNVVREDYILEWSSVFPKIKVAIGHGNRFLFTSRTHIYNFAKHRLGTRNLEEFSTEEAIVTVGNLNQAEKEKILYNHIKFGDQKPKWKAQAKKFLPEVANSDKFLAGVAMRLGKSDYTKKVKPEQNSLVEFMNAPEGFLEETIRELTDDIKAALYLIYASQNEFIVTPEPSEIATRISATTGINYPKILQALRTLGGSFVQRTSEGYWKFDHPTIADAITEILLNEPHMLHALIGGAPINMILSNFVCEGQTAHKNAFVVTPNLEEMLIQRLLEVDDHYIENSKLFSFLANRVSDNVFKQVVDRMPDIFERTTWQSWRISGSSKYSFCARAYLLGLLPEDIRERTVEKIIQQSDEEFDFEFLSSTEIMQLFTPLEAVKVGFKAYKLMDKEMESTLSNISYNADLSDEVGDNFMVIRESLEVLSSLLEVSPEEDDLFQTVETLVNEEQEKLRDRQIELEAEQEVSSWLEIETSVETSAPLNDSVATRSIFDDVDQ